MRKSRLGIPYLEFALAFVLLGILAIVLNNRLLYIREQSEKTAFELTIRNMRSGLWLEKARRIARGIPLEALQGSNPVRYLQTAPQGYRGETGAADLSNLTAGGWIFVASDGVLYYKPLMHQHLQMDAPVFAILIKNDLQVTPPYQWF